MIPPVEPSSYTTNEVRTQVHSISEAQQEEQLAKETISEQIGVFARNSRSPSQDDINYNGQYNAEGRQLQTQRIAMARMFGTAHGFLDSKFQREGNTDGSHILNRFPIRDINISLLQEGDGHLIYIEKNTETGEPAKVTFFVDSKPEDGKSSRLSVTCPAPEGTELSERGPSVFLSNVTDETLEGIDPDSIKMTIESHESYSA